MIYSFKGFTPVINKSSFVHPLAAVTGNVTIGKNVYIGPGAALRGDWGAIRIEDGCNVQENCAIHMFPGVTVVLERDAHIGHGAIIHGAHIGKNVLVGMNAVIMDEAIVGDNSIIGALCFVKAQMIIEERSLVVGNPARIVKKVDDKMLDWKYKGTLLYQTLAGECHSSLFEVEALQYPPENQPQQEKLLETWRQIQDRKS